MQHRLAVTGVLLLSFVLGACATIVEGSDQTVTVITEPTGAICTLNRDGEAISVANPTPGTVSIDKSKDNISIICEKDGYFNGAASLSSDFKAMTFGNIIFGGVVGLVCTLNRDGEAINGGGIMLHAERPDGSVAAAQKCAIHGPLSVATRGGGCTAWSSMRRFDWRLSTRV